ncbi:aspartyl protease family protein [Pseudoalteromonas sp. MSK9-3]|uniref:aspartyl protease family protein n=1 Tax=Pseudoalteromonas sp. MSK9-3 TaxID=1897633 RepID=UPI000E6D3851|nr:aspartyl protease family protein [Pseudoalteromonas sp. MSK9-3]
MMNIIRTLIVITALIMMSGCNIINIFKLRSANDDVVPNWHSQFNQFDIKTDYIGEKTFIYGSINGVDNFKFLIDTGASFTILLDSPKVRALTLPKGYELQLGGWGDEEDSQSHQITMDSLKFGDLEVRQFHGAFIKTSKTRYFDRPDELIFDGVIGHDLLRHFSWTFNKKANQVSVSKHPFTPSKNTYAIPFDIFMSKLYVEGKVDFGDQHTTQQDIIIDTGSRHYLKLSAQYLENHKIPLPPAYVTGADIGLSGKTEHKRVSLPSVSFGKLTLPHIKTNLIENADEDDYWVIGNGIFNQFETTVDYFSKTLYLTPISNHKMTIRYNLMGLEVRKLLSGEFLVRYVMPNLPGEGAGIKAGDVITHLNTIPTKKISKDEWLTYSTHPATYTLCLENKACVELTSQHIPGYSTH